MHKNLATFTLFVFLVLTAGGCKAQGAGAALSPEVSRRIQNEIRSRYSVPSQVQITIAAPQPSDVPNFDKIIVTFVHAEKKTDFDFLISKDRGTLARLEKIDISQDLMSKIDVKGRPLRGNQSAKVTIVNYDDFECPFCARMHATLFPGLIKAYGDKVKIIYKDYPLVEIHPWAMHAAIDANCLNDQSGDAYWDFADYLHTNAKTVSGANPKEAFSNLDKQTIDEGGKFHLDAQKLKACVQKSDDSAVRISMAEAEKLGVDSTPTLFINGDKVSGAQPEEDIRAMIDRALADAGEKTPSASAKN